MFDSWVLRPEQLNVDKIKAFMEVGEPLEDVLTEDVQTVFAPLPNAAVRVARAVKLGEMLKKHRVTRSHTKVQS